MRKSALLLTTILFLSGHAWANWPELNQKNFYASCLHECAKTATGKVANPMQYCDSSCRCSLGNAQKTVTLQELTLLDVQQSKKQPLDSGVVQKLIDAATQCLPPSQKPKQEI